MAEERQNPLEGLMPPPTAQSQLAALADRLERVERRARQTKQWPSEKKRVKRQLACTFRDPSIPGRVKALARRWNWTTNEGQRPNYSRVIEHLLTPQLEAAERGEIEPIGDSA